MSFSECEYAKKKKRTVVSGSQPSMDYYWNQQWKCVYAQDSSDSSHSFRYAYGLRRRNELLMREEFTPSLTAIFPLCDAMSGRTTLIDGNATVLERYRYSAFGVVTILNPDYSVKDSSSYNWDVLFHGEMIDLSTNWYNYGFRWYIPPIGRWPSRDPIGENGGINLYAFVYNDSVNQEDLLGMRLPIKFTGPWGLVASVFGTLYDWNRCQAGDTRKKQTTGTCRLWCRKCVLVDGEWIDPGAGGGMWVHGKWAGTIHFTCDVIALGHGFWTGDHTDITTPCDAKCPKCYVAPYPVSYDQDTVIKP